MSAMPQSGKNVRPASLHTTNHALKVMAKWVLWNDDLVLFLKAAKIAIESRAGKASDLIYPAASRDHRHIRSCYHRCRRQHGPVRFPVGAPVPGRADI